VKPSITPAGLIYFGRAFLPSLPHGYIISSKALTRIAETFNAPAVIDRRYSKLYCGSANGEAELAGVGGRQFVHGFGFDGMRRLQQSFEAGESNL
jgi:hypothetical protein